jgi:hypothetical protein
MRARWQGTPYLLEAAEFLVRCPPGRTNALPAAPHPAEAALPCRVLRLLASKRPFCAATCIRPMHGHHMSKTTTRHVLARDKPRHAFRTP